MTHKAYAKINWHLEVLGKLENGYHRLDMLMQQISLHDEITIEPAETMSLQVKGMPHLTQASNNLALRAAMLLKETYDVNSNVQITLKKVIPIGAGLGGGSADAACVLHACNSLWHLGLSSETLSRLGLKLGADVPFCLQGGLCHVTGIGETLSPLPIDKQYWLLVIQPCRGLSTKDVFSSLHLMPGIQKAPSTMAVYQALISRNFSTLQHACQNDLQDTSVRQRPQIALCIDDLKNTGAKLAMMSGSGSAVFGIYASYPQAQAAWRRLSKKYKTAHLCYTMKDAAHP